MHSDSTRRPKAPITPQANKFELYFPPHLVEEHPEYKATIAGIAQNFFCSIGLPQILRWEAAARQAGNSFTHFMSISLLLKVSCPGFNLSGDVEIPRDYYPISAFPPLLQTPTSPNSAVRKMYGVSIEAVMSQAGGDTPAVDVLSQLQAARVTLLEQAADIRMLDAMVEEQQQLIIVLKRELEQNLQRDLPVRAVRAPSNESSISSRVRAEAPPVALPQFSPSSSITPLRVLGPNTALFVRSHALPNTLHPKLCELVSEEPSMFWLEFLVENGIVSEDIATDLVDAMLSDVFSS